MRVTLDHEEVFHPVLDHILDAFSKLGIMHELIIMYHGNKHTYVFDGKKLKQYGKRNRRELSDVIFKDAADPSKFAGTCTPKEA